MMTVDEFRALLGAVKGMRLISKHSAQYQFESGDAIIIYFGSLRTIMLKQKGHITYEVDFSSGEPKVVEHFKEGSIESAEDPIGIIAMAEYLELI